MENLLGWFLIPLVVLLPVFAVYTGIKLYRKRVEKIAEQERLREESLRKLKKEREDSWARAKSGATHVGKTTYDYNLDRSRTTVTERDTGRRMSYVHENDSGPDLLTTALIANMLFNNKESSAGTVSWKDDVPTVTETSSSSSSSSWGLDDDDSRKSSSSSFSSSDSSSSWDSGSSSSDSGPSSDW